MGKALLSTVALTAVFASVGCMATPSWLASATEKVPYVGKSKTEQGFSLSGGPDFSKSYEEYSAEHQQRNIVSPALGLDGNVEPSRTQRWTKAVTDSSVVRSVSGAFKSAKDKASNVVMPRKGPPPSAVSLATEVGVPTPELFLTSARISEKSGDLAGAEAQYRRALGVAPENMAALLGSAHLLDRQGRFAEALALYAKAAELHPNEAAPQNDLGLCLARQNRLPEAVVALEKAVTLQPNRKLYRNNVATVMVELGRVDEALSHLASVHGEAVAHHNIGYLLHKLGDTETAARHFVVASQIDPSMSGGRQNANGMSPMTPPSQPRPTAPGPRSQPLTGRQAIPAETAPRYQSRVSREAAASAPPTRSPGGPVNLPEWSQSPDRRTHAAAPPVPDRTGDYQPFGLDPATIAPTPQDLLRHLPPVDPNYIPRSRY